MIISYKNLASVRKKYPDKKIVFCSGSFDLIHPGHVLTFEALKKLGDILVVAVGGDKDIAEIKGPTRPILNEDLRLKMVDSLKPVDYALAGDQDSPVRRGRAAGRNLKRLFGE